MCDRDGVRVANFVETNGRPVLSRDTALALGHQLLDLVRTVVDHDSIRIRIEHTARAVTRVSNGQVSNADYGDWVRISFHSKFGSGLPIWISTNQVADAGLRQILAQAAAIAPPPESGAIEPDDPDDIDNFMYNAREYPRVSLWHETTARALGASANGGDAPALTTAVPDIVERLRAAQLTGSATVGFAARSILYLYKQGLTAFAEETDSEVTVTARTPDGPGSGWSGQVNRDWTKITSGTVVAQAIDVANRSRGIVAMEPGRRVAILGPAAVAQLVYGMAYAFDAGETLVPLLNGKPATPFALPRRANGPHSRLGTRVFDSRITMVSNPGDPLGGFPPFFDWGGIELNIFGFPFSVMTWIEGGILKNLAYNVFDGLERHLPPCDIPLSVHLAATPGTQTATIADMIANCAEGVYVNRFSDVAVIDKLSGMMTGVTRDGCFLIKHGKIEKPIKNLRFTDSPFFGFNRLEMIGTSERVAFGFNTPSGNRGGVPRWPRLPIIVPPMMLRDFNFSGLADAV